LTNYKTKQLHGSVAFLEKLAIRQLVKISPHVMEEPKGSLPCSQEPAACAYPEPSFESTPSHPVS